MNGDGKRKPLAKPDYHLLMTNPELELEKNKEKDNPIVKKYGELASKYGYKISAINDDSETRHLPREVLYRAQLKRQLLFGKIYEEIKTELSQFGSTDEEIADILVKYLYGIKDSKNKDLLWACYGEYLYKNLEQNVKPSTKEVQCVDCGEWFEVLSKDNRACRCSKCQHEMNNKNTRKRMKKYRSKDDVTLSNTD